MYVFYVSTITQQQQQQKNDMACEMAYNDREKIGGNGYGSVLLLYYDPS